MHGIFLSVSTSSGIRRVSAHTATGATKSNHKFLKDHCLLNKKKRYIVACIEFLSILHLSPSRMPKTAP